MASVDPESRHEVTALLQRMADGDRHAGEELYPIVYGELHRLAAGYMRKERVGHTVQATALVHEAFLRLVQKEDLEAENRLHFVRIAGRAMRFVLADYARSREAEKRRCLRDRVALDDEASAPGTHPVDLVALHEALERLAALDEELYRLVELRFFSGMSMPEIADSLGISVRSAGRAWQTARALLQCYLSEESDGSGLEDPLPPQGIKDH